MGFATDLGESGIEVSLASFIMTEATEIFSAWAIRRSQLEKD